MDIDPEFSRDMSDGNSGHESHPTLLCDVCHTRPTTSCHLSSMHRIVPAHILAGISDPLAP